ncbi:MAG: DUF5320 domain-containing protein [Candidatus Magasanikbacteria bacterium]
MPKLDGTGPMGQGAGSGRGMGSCGNGTGIRRGCCGRYGQGRRRFISSKNELTALEDEEKMLLEDLKIVKAEKEALEAQK